MILENPADSEKLTFYDYSIPFFVFSTAGAPVIIKGIHSSPVHILLRSGATSSFDGIFLLWNVENKETQQKTT